MFQDHEENEIFTTEIGWSSFARNKIGVQSR